MEGNHHMLTHQDLDMDHPTYVDEFSPRYSIGQPQRYWIQACTYVESWLLSEGAYELKLPYYGGLALGVSAWQIYRAFY